MRILSYKNFGDFANSGAEDLETFITSLSAEDQAAFKNNENCVVIFVSPEKDNGFVAGSEGDDVVRDIVAGSSTVVNFDQAVTIKNKIGNGMYLVFAFGNSAVRPAEMKLVKTAKAKVAKAMRKRKSAAVIKAEMKARKARILKKYNSAIETNTSHRQILKARANQLSAQIAQRKQLEAMGAFDTEDSLAAYGNQNAKFVMGLDDTDAAIFEKAKKLYAVNPSNPKIEKLINTMDNPQMAIRVLTGEGRPMNRNEIIDKRYTQLRKQLRKLTARMEQLRLSLSLAPQQKVRSIKSMISSTKTELAKVAGALNAYKNNAFDSRDTMTNKLAEMLEKKLAYEKQLASAPQNRVNSIRSMISKLNSKIKRLNDRIAASDLTPQQRYQSIRAEIEANVATGDNLKVAMRKALSELDATPQQKQIIKQQIAQQVAQGMPVQFAAMQAQQQVLGNQLGQPSNVDLDGNELVNNILNNL